MSRLEVAPRARAQIQTIAAWWRANRQAAPDLFARELAEALEGLTVRPTAGAPYAERRGITIRRLLLKRSRYHVYFSWEEEARTVRVRAMWHASRGHGPRLG